MKFIMVEEGKIYTPAGHDASVMSRSIYKGEVDIHVTSFPAGAGMEEELHEDLSHVFLMLKGSMEVLQKGELIKRLKANDAVYIPAGELHEIQNNEEEEAVFLAVTFPNR